MSEASASGSISGVVSAISIFCVRKPETLAFALMALTLADSWSSESSRCLACSNSANRLATVTSLDFPARQPALKRFHLLSIVKRFRGAAGIRS